jgi:hypothetical protein
MTHPKQGIYSGVGGKFFMEITTDQGKNEILKRDETTVLETERRKTLSSIDQGGLTVN